MSGVAINFKLILRLLFMPAALFVMCVLVHLGQSSEKLVGFLQNWKGIFSVALFIVLLHATVEIKVAVEDYVKNLTFRSLLLKGLYVKAFFIFVLIIISLAKV